MSLVTTKVEKFNGERDLWSQYPPAGVSPQCWTRKRGEHHPGTEAVGDQDQETPGFGREKSDCKTTARRKVAIEAEVTGIDKKLLEERRAVCSRLLETLEPKVTPIVQSVAAQMI